jgi:hypothetical protein
LKEISIEENMEKIEGHQNENRLRFEEYNRDYRETFENDNLHHKIMIDKQKEITKKI